MTIRIKIAATAKELNDVYRLRYQVYVENEGCFKDSPSELVVDQFDSIPNTANIIAYDELSETPVATMRLNCDSEILLPSDETFDFGPYRAKINQQRQQDGLTPAKIVSAGMLAIAQPWRNRRDVFLALFKLAADIAHRWDITHIIASVSVKSVTIYRRLKFEILSEPFWVDAIGDEVVAVAQPFELFYRWALGSIQDKTELMETFSGCFEYLLVDANTAIFNQHEPGHEAYLINKGHVTINQSTEHVGTAVRLASLKRGALFGEIALIDEQPRSASANTTARTELMVLSKAVFWRKIEQDPAYLKNLLKTLSVRLRQTDERAVMYAHAPVEARLTFFINSLYQGAVRSDKNPQQRSCKITLEEFAHMAGAPLGDTRDYLATQQAQGKLAMTETDITFYQESEI